jgi:hypothetical protein
MRWNKGHFMKRTLFLMLAAFLIAGMTPACANAQSLGDVARHQREVKRAKATKVVTNEDIPASPVADTAPASSAAPATDANKGSDKKSDSTPEAADVRAKASEASQARYNDQKKGIAQLEHDIDIMQREHKLRVAAYYGDAGNSLRDPKAWAEQERKYNADLAEKQQSLEDAKKKLADFQEQARKAGLQVKDQ